MKKLIFLLVMILHCGLNADDFWKPAQGLSGPSSISDIAVDSDNNIFVTNGSELFKSTDGGSSWSSIQIELEDYFHNTIYNLKTRQFGGLYFFNYPNLYNNCINLFKLDKDSNQLYLYFTSYGQSISSNNNIYICDSNIALISGSKTSLISSHPDHLSADIYPVRENLWEFKPTGLYYDCRFGLILRLSKNYTYDNEEHQHFNSTNFGNTWHELFNTIPGTDIPLKSFRIINENLWLVNTGDYYNGLYNFELDTLILDFPVSVKYYTFGKNLYWTSLRGLFHSSDGGLSYEKISDNIFGNSYWIDAFAIDSSGNFFASSRYERFIKSTDNGISWTRIFLDTKKCFDFDDMQLVNDNLYSFDHRNNIFCSIDSGKSWELIPMQNQKYYVNNFDVNSKGEIVYGDGKNIAYSSDKGNNWSYIDSSLKDIYKNDIGSVEIFENGNILFNGSYLAKSSKDTFKLIDYCGNQIMEINEGEYISIFYESIAILDSSFNKIKVIDVDPNDERIVNYSLSMDGDLYIATSNGIYLLESFDVSPKIISFEGRRVNNVYVDKNNYIFAWVDYNIFVSQNGGKNFTNVSSNLKKRFSSMFAFGDGRVITKSDKVYYCDYKESDFIKTSVTYTTDTLYKDQNWSCAFSITNQFDLPIDSATIYIANSITNNFDTILTNSHGIAIYSITPNNYFSEGIDAFNIYYYADKLSCYTSQVADFKLYVRTDYDSRFIKNKTKYYYICHPDTNVTYNLKISNSHNENLQGIIVIENYSTNTIDSIDYNGQNYADYSFYIPQEIENGMYKLKIKGLTLTDDNTADYETYIVVNSGESFISVEKDCTVDELLSDCHVRPNPTTGNATILFSLIEQSEINIKVYNALGIEVSNLAVNEFFDSGQHNIQLDTEDLTSGMYFCILKAGDKIQTAKFVITK